MRFRVLIVDDEKNQREMLAGFLERNGYTTKTADSAEAALEVLDKSAFEIGLFDMRMAGMSGLGLYKIARDRDPEMQVVLITAFWQCGNCCRSDARRGFHLYF